MAFLRPYAGAGLGYVVNALSGSDILLVYMIPILKDSGLDLDRTLLDLAPIIIGVVRTIGAGLIPLFCFDSEYLPALDALRAQRLFRARAVKLWIKTNTRLLGFILF